jgi:protoheme ferro-lyase
VKDIPEALLDAYSEAFEDIEDAPDSERWQEMLKDVFRGFSDFRDATELVQAFVDSKREEAEEESLLVRSLRVMLDAHGVPSDVAEKVIGPIEEWEKTPAKS